MLTGREDGSREMVDASTMVSVRMFEIYEFYSK